VREIRGGFEQSSGGFLALVVSCRDLPSSDGPLDMTEAWATTKGRAFMVKRISDAEWHGDLQNGGGTVSFGSGAFNGPYSYKSRFEDGSGTNPEELIAAAHAACFSMALSLALSQAGHPPTRVHTKAIVQFGPVPDGFAISRIDLETEGTVPGIDAATFESFASQAKIHCPVSKALAAVEIGLSAKLV